MPVNTANSLTPDLRNFLRSSATNVEWMSDELRQALSQETGLEKVVKEAVSRGRTVVIAGTAGSGKTHLLKASGARDGYRVIPDLAGHPQNEWPALLAIGTKAIIAGNEGAFLLGKQNGIEAFEEVVSLLHSIQRGVACNGTEPVVIDAAAFDPCGQHVVADMLGNSLLSEYVQSTEDPQRVAAWQMLADPAVRERVATLVEVASAETETDGFTFRQLWQFVADLADGGEGQKGLWFWRVFYGDSQVSRRICDVFSPSLLALPHTGNHLWYSDLIRASTDFLDCCQDILEETIRPPGSVRNGELSEEKFEILRILSGFGLQESPIQGLLKQSNELWTAIRDEQDCERLLECINNYMTYGVAAGGSDLQLWIQHDTERRQQKPPIQLSMGVSDVSEFEIRRNRVVANAPRGTPDMFGGRYLLTHLKSGAVMAITKDFVEGLLRGRSHRTIDRRSVEYDWRLLRFFSQVAAEDAQHNKLRAAFFDFQARTASFCSWQSIGSRLKRIADG